MSKKVNKKVIAVVEELQAENLRVRESLGALVGLVNVELKKLADSDRTLATIHEELNKK